ncbi:hypothetical protein NMG60_11016627 [Bertholletia excelsa]
MRRLRGRWLTIQAVIEDAEERQLRDTRVKLWLKKLRDVAYDADDLLDWLTTRVLQSQARTSKVCALAWTFRPFFIRLKMLRELSDIRERLDDIAKDISDFQLRDVFIHRHIDPAERSETGPCVNESEVFGREEDVENMVQMLLSSSASVSTTTTAVTMSSSSSSSSSPSPSRPSSSASSSKSNQRKEETVSVISIVGMGGIGKTTLAQLVYNDERVMRHFDMRMWISVNNIFSFNVRKIISNILDYAGGVKWDESSPLGILQFWLQESLRGKRFLLVLDDVWNQNLQEWEKLKSPLAGGSTGGSKIIVTTRNNVVADIMSTSLPYYLEALTEEDTWNLFKQKAFSEGEEAVYLNLLCVGRRIISKCRGVPLAAKVLGTLMRFQRDENEWLSVEQSELSDLCKGSILPILRLSYNHLLPCLKRCFEYCAVFPKGYEMNKEKLIHQWVAEGLIQSPGDGISGRKMEDTGNDYFKELLSTSFFQVVRECDGKILEFKMHDLIHDLAKHITRNEILILCQNHPPSLSLANNAQLRHLSVEGKVSSLLLLGASSAVKKLRTLNLLCAGDDSGKVLATLMPQLRQLRVLNLSGCGIKFLHRNIGNLILVRYLDLSNTPIQRLPESVSHLCNLQTLNLSGCKHLVELPSGTSNLINLRHLNIKDCQRLTSMPTNIGKLRNLQTLPMFIIGHMLEQSLFQLEHLDLRGELQIKHLESVGNIVIDLCLVNKQLDTLALSWRNENEWKQGPHSRGQSARGRDGNAESVLNCLQPNHNLKRLSLHGYSGVMFPQWMNHSVLPKLTDLVLTNCRRCKCLPILGQLPLLKVLNLQGMDAVEKITSDFYGKEGRRRSFPSLKVLTLQDFPELRNWESTDSMEAFPSLDRLTVIKCPKLTSMPCFQSLQHLELRECNSVVLESASELNSLSTLLIETFLELLFIPEALFQNNSLLMSLTINSCPQLGSLPPSIGVLSTLKSLTILGCNELENLPHGFLQLTSLENLEIVGCPRLVPLTGESLKGLKSLRSLYIENHSNLTIF